MQRRAGGASDFENLESFESFAPLKTKGQQGGSYVYLDADSGLQPGTCAYRVLTLTLAGLEADAEPHPWPGP